MTQPTLPIDDELLRHQSTRMPKSLRHKEKVETLTWVGWLVGI